MFRVEKAGLVGFGGASIGGKIQHDNDASTASQHILQLRNFFPGLKRQPVPPGLANDAHEDGILF